MLSKSDLIKGFSEIGIKDGTKLLVHSSLSSFGYVEGGTDTIIDALIESVSPNGTVLVPTLTGSAELSSDNPPTFDVLNTPCWTGKIPETFRKRKNAKRSYHPTHSVSGIGADVDILIKNHHEDITPCGIKSPYFKLGELGGYVLLIGVGFDVGTTFHTVEELAEVDYHLQKEMTNCIVIKEDGKKMIVRNYLHSYLGPERNFLIMEDIFKEKEIMRYTQIGKALIRMFPTKESIEITLDYLKKDPLFLAKKIWH